MPVLLAKLLKPPEYSASVTIHETTSEVIPGVGFVHRAFPKATLTATTLAGKPLTEQNARDAPIFWHAEQLVDNDGDPARSYGKKRTLLRPPRCIVQRGGERILAEHLPAQLRDLVTICYLPDMIGYSFLYALPFTTTAASEIVYHEGRRTGPIIGVVLDSEGRVIEPGTQGPDIPAETHTVSLDRGACATSSVLVGKSYEIWVGTSFGSGTLGTPRAAPGVAVAAGGYYHFHTIFGENWFVPPDDGPTFADFPGEINQADIDYYVAQNQAAYDRYEARKVKLFKYNYEGADHVGDLSWQPYAVQDAHANTQISAMAASLASYGFGAPEFRDTPEDAMWDPAVEMPSLWAELLEFFGV